MIMGICGKMQSLNSKPVLGITMGDPAGVGPEVVLKALVKPDVHRMCHPVIIGDGSVLEQARRALGIDIILRPTELGALGSERWLAATAADEGSEITFIDLEMLKPGEIKVGELQPKAGRAAVEYIKVATDLALSGSLAGIVTAPINKAAMNMAGFAYAGHTELLQTLTGAKDVAMLLYLGRLGISHVTTHVSMGDACRLVTKARVLQVIRLTYAVAVQLDQTDKPLAVAGLNPHSGEGGLFGKEELLEIAPALEQAKNEGINVVGPLPPDTVFLKAHGGTYDFVIAMYHDQGHIPAKLLGFERGVNVTLGLPIVRTSVDHGTAFDIAGKGIADCRSMVEAIKLATRLAKV